MVARKLKIPCSIVACSGSYVEIASHIIFQETLPNSVAKELIDITLSTQAKPAFIITSDDYRLLGKTWKMGRWMRFFLMVALFFMGRYAENISYRKDVFDNFINDEKRGTFKFFVALLNFKGNSITRLHKLLKEKYGDTLMINKMSKGIEILASSNNKGLGIAKIQKLLQIEDEEIVVVGDDGNDIPMFKMYPHSFVMDSGNAQAKTYAKHVINNFHELLDFIQKYNKENK
jgi:HAD superfamily hydrolase (TIGR01484 family)